MDANQQGENYGQNQEFDEIITGFYDAEKAEQTYNRSISYNTQSIKQDDKSKQKQDSNISIKEQLKPDKIVAMGQEKKATIQSQQFESPKDAIPKDAIPKHFSLNFEIREANAQKQQSQSQEVGNQSQNLTINQELEKNMALQQQDLTGVSNLNTQFNNSSHLDIPTGPIKV